MAPCFLLSLVIFIFVVGFGTYITNGCEDSYKYTFPMSEDGKALRSSGTRVCQPEACGGVMWLSLSHGGSWRRHISVGRSEREDEGYARTQPSVEIGHSFRPLPPVIFGRRVCVT